MNEFELPIRLVRGSTWKALHAQITSALQGWTEAERRAEQADADTETLSAEATQWHEAYLREVEIANRSEEALKAQADELAALRRTVDEQAAELAVLRRMLGGHEEARDLIDDPERPDGESVRAQLVLGAERRRFVHERALGLRSGPLNFLEQLIFPTHTERAALESGAKPKELE